jgi:signal transduction histidine kinase/ActR/RegA family two-component response regulator
MTRFARFRLNSLRSRLMLLVALAILPTAVMTILGGLQEREHAFKLTEDSLQRLTRLAAANEAQSIDSARQILVDLSSNPDLRGDAGKCSALLAEVLAKNSDFVNFGLIQMDGNVSCSAVPMVTPINLADRAHFKRAIAERRFIASNYVFGRVIQKHTINLTYPVIGADNKVVAVVFAAMELAGLDRFINDVDLPPGSILVTADAAGNIISRRPDPEQWFGKQVSPKMLEIMARAPHESALLSGEDGIERLHTFARIGPSTLTDYSVTIGVPTADIIAAARETQKMALIGLIGTTLIALLATWFVGEMLIVRRVRKLMNTADEIASGSLGARSGISYGREEIGRLARALDEMASALQKKELAHQRAELELRAADQRKDDFLAMLAHELRNPLAPISTAAHLLRVVHAGDVHIAQTAAIISRQVDHMTGLVDDLLDVSRVTRGLVALARERLDMTAVVADAVEQVTPLATARNHRLELRLPSEPAVVEGDHKRLVQVVANLLNNATKYTNDGGHIVVRLESAPHAHMLTITDNGIGMAPELVERVFDLFAQAERTPDRSQGGLGLGLALVKSLVDLHGGTVEARSAGLGAGSTFIVRLPRFEAGQLARRAKGAEIAIASDAERLRVLLVDDNSDAIDVLQACLQAAGHEVRVAYTSNEALAMARAEPPDACLIDIGLPDFDGNQLARIMRDDPRLRAAVLIAMTGYGRREDRDKSITAGFDDYLVKPLDIVKLSAMLANLGRKRGLAAL